MPQMIVREEGSEKVFDVVDDCIKVGRSPKCKISITDKTASRVHCEIVKTPSGYLMRDLGSRNGTLVNGKRAGEKLLSVGDVIEIGQTVIFFEREEAARAGRFSVSREETTMRRADEERARLAKAKLAELRPEDREIDLTELESLAADADPYEFDVVAAGRHTSPVKFIVIATLATVALALAVIIFFPRGPHTPQEPHDSTIVAGNLIPENPSFEIGTDESIQGWSPSGPASASRTTDFAKTGLSSLKISLAKSPETQGRSPQPHVCACTSSKTIPISQGRIYRLGAWARAAEISGLAGVKVTWFKNETELLSSSATNLLSRPTPAWELLECTVELPRDATLARVSCFLVASSGEVYFDDVSLVARTAPDFSWAAEAKSQDYSIASDSHGLIKLSAGGSLLLESGPPSVATTSGIEMSDPVFFPIHRDVSNLPSEISLSGRILDPCSLDMVEFDQSIRTTEDSASITYTLHGNARAAMTIITGRKAIASGIELVTTSLPLIHDPEPFGEEGVLSMSFFLGPRIIKFAYSEPIDLNVSEEGGNLLFSHVAPSGALTIAVEYQEAPLSDELRTGITEAHQAILDGLPGKAILLLRSVAADPKAPEETKRELSDLEKKAKSLVASAADAHRSGAELRNTDILARARQTCESLARDYAGTEFATSAAALVEKIDEAVWEIETSTAESQAEKLWKAAQYYDSQGKSELASLYCSEIVERFPRSTIASQARTLLEKLRGQQGK